MTPNLRRRSINAKKIISSTDSSDSDFYVLPYKKVQPERYKSVQKNLNSIFDEDNPMDGNSSNDTQLVVRKDNSKSDTNTKSKDRINHQESDILFLSEADNNSRETIIQNKKNHAENKENGNINYDSDETIYDLSASTNQNKRKLKLSDNNKRKRNKVEVVRHRQNTDSQSSEDHCSNQIITSTAIKQSKQAHKEKQETVQNFQPSITKVIEELSYKFSKFKLQMKRLQLKHIKENIVTLQDAGDMIFIFNCIISKLKDELTEQQQQLTNAYIQWSTKHKCNHIDSDVQYKQCANDKNFQVENETNYKSSSDTEMFSENDEVNKSSKENVQTNDKDSTVITNDKVHQQNHRNDKNDQLPLETVDACVGTPQQLIECDSDISSTCTTVDLYPSKYSDIPHIDEHDSTLIDTDGIRKIHELENLVSEVTILKKPSDDKVQATSMHYSDSDDTIIIPRSRQINCSMQHLIDKKNDCSQTTAKASVVALNDENSVTQQQSNVIVSSANIINILKRQSPKTVNENENNVTDKKLRMDCHVLVKKLKKRLKH